ncbi:MAG: biotin--[acetyl-CoA-carboxylase] ligase [Sphingomonas bacterium]|jgi:BirA family biotin operon repressor/biotin-[acetyl-CoA-carboxylase] ligase|nr:biotin--[acetyl-CoA-carboxylase] ligase [Sphingomonas bacterium]MDB5689414.1 biotin--[acetyl-CoA-carboxylase] ligase [Sphingomonas bacterium]
MTITAPVRSQAAIRAVPTTGSTNDDVVALARAGAGEGIWVRADVQTGGRGRLGRSWVSPPGNLYASTLVRLVPGDPAGATLALVAAVALEELIGALAGRDRVKIKWPNDLLLRTGPTWCKLSGILLERADDAIVIGIGVNLAHYPADLDRPVASLAAAGIDPPAPSDFAVDLADAFARWLSRWRGEGLAPVRRRWLERAHPIGTALVARQADGSAIEGLFDGLAEDGALRLRLADGGVHVMHAGDVFLL